MARWLALIDLRERGLGYRAETDAVGERGLHGLEGLQVAANALRHREGGGVVLRVGNAVAGLDLLGSDAESRLRGAKRSQSNHRTNIRIDRIRHKKNPSLLGSNLAFCQECTLFSIGNPDARLENMRPYGQLDKKKMTAFH
jgi:hypothetical protein